MTTRRAGTQPTPEQVAAGGPPPSIEILTERLTQTYPTPGEVRQVVAVTYRDPPNPPQVVFVPPDDLPAWVWRRTNPDAPVPEEIQQRSDAILRERIRARRRPAGPPRRMI